MSRRLAWFTQGIKDILHNLMVLLTKLYLLMIVGVLLGMGWVLFLYKSQVFTQLWAKLAVIIGVGVSTGIISRMVFTKNKVLMAWLSAVLAIIVCLWCLNWITEGQVGFSLFPSWPNSVNWDGIWQLLTGMGIAWVTVSAYKSAHIHTSPIPRPIFRRPAPDVSLKKTEEVKPARLHKQEVDLSISHPLAEAEPAPVEELAAKIKPVKPKAKTKAGLQIGKKNSLVKTGKKRTTPPALPPHRCLAEGFRHARRPDHRSAVVVPRAGQAPRRARQGRRSNFGRSWTLFGSIPRPADPRGFRRRWLENSGRRQRLFVLAILTSTALVDM